MNQPQKNYETELFDETNGVASVTECTGLMQIPPTNEEEADAYSEIYVVPEQVNDLGSICRKNTKENDNKHK